MTLTVLVRAYYAGARQPLSHGGCCGWLPGEDIITHWHHAYERARIRAPSVY